MRLVWLLVLCVAAAVFSGAAVASITVSERFAAPSLRVDARGYAEVSWTQAGSRRTLLIPPRGQYLPGGKLSGADVSLPARDVKLPLAVVVRRTADGRLWALQRWRVQAGGPVELRFSRWTGAPTAVVAKVANGKLTGRATFAGKGVFGTSPTTAGAQIRHYALVDCRGCPGARGWQRLLGVALHGPAGRFSLSLTPKRSGNRYRVTVAGPNRGTTYAPDATAVVTTG